MIPSALPSRVSAILAPNPSPMTGRGTNTYIVQGGAETVVIDPGPDIESHLAAVAAAAGSRVAGVLLTHHHVDHSESARALADRLGAPVLGFPHPHMPDLDVVLADHERLSFGDTALEVVATPGHSSDHACFVLRDQGAVFAGDLVAGEGFIVIDPPDGDMALYLESLRRLRDLGPTILLPAHGEPIHGAAALLDTYISHRLDREERVLTAAVGGGDWRSLDEVLAVAYDDVNPAMWPVARRSLLAHLNKLVEDGRLAREGQRSDETARYRAKGRSSA